MPSFLELGAERVESMETVAGYMRRLVPPSLRFSLHTTAGWMRELRDCAQLWRWELSEVLAPEVSPYRVVFLGRTLRRRAALLLLGRPPDSPRPDSAGDRLAHTVLVSEAPLPGALRVPFMVNAVVPLGRPLEEVVAGYKPEVRRLLRQQRGRYQMRPARDEAEIDQADQNMLRPYARARHNEQAFQLEASVVRKMALGYGRLDLVHDQDEDELVACQLGHPTIRSGQRYWTACRFGYPEEVFRDGSRLRDVNTVNAHLALEWAAGNGYDHLDLGESVARPDGGLLQWKRRRGAHVDVRTNTVFLHVRLPRQGRAEFLWDAPLFTTQRGAGALGLVLGLPAERSDDEFAARYREMGYGGVTTVYLHHARPPGPALLSNLSRLWKGRGVQPRIELIPVEPSRLVSAPTPISEAMVRTTAAAARRRPAP